MRKLFSILLFVVGGLVFFGCSEDYSPVNSSIAGADNLQLIKMPSKTGVAIEGVQSTSADINGNKGGSLSLSYSYPTLTGTVTVSVDLNIPAGAFSGNKNISITADDETASLTFGPHGTFNEPLNLNYSVSGLGGVDLSGAGFYYVGDDGSIESVSYGNLNAGNGSLAVNNAKLNHFSRYAWAK